METSLTLKYFDNYMKKIVSLSIFSLFINGVVTGESVLVYEGDSVTLHTNTNTQRDHLIEWRFGDHWDLIARINGDANLLKIYDDVLDERFSSRLKMNNQTGDLTITNITTQHNGVYKLEITNRATTTKTFIFNVSGDTDKVKTEMMGDSVILHNNVIKKSGDEKMMWRIRHNNSLVAEIEVSHADVHERFRDRLYVNLQTGNLIITHIRPEDFGSYEVDITVGSHIYTIHRSFSVKVKDQSPGSTSRLVTSAICVVLLLLLAVALAVAVIFYKRRSRTTVIETTVNETVPMNEEHGGGAAAAAADDVDDGAAADDGEREELKVDEGESADLKTEITDIQRVEKIEWRFNETLIAEINPADNIFSTYDGDDNIFRDKLELNPQTGDLNIKDFTQEHTGVYTLKIIRDGETSYRRFNVSVREEKETEPLIEGKSATFSRREDPVETRGKDPEEKRGGESVEIEMPLLPT
ncbi:uncharacterized protein [Misgurnus anguillicaudatus]|uniref:uncharacterized protein isoform X1 n=1 Tax=Misgurnus anguillicaudatus TaxID=75329 RepID=UPI003CCF3326